MGGQTLLVCVLLSALVLVSKAGRECCFSPGYSREAGTDFSSAVCTGAFMDSILLCSDLLQELELFVGWGSRVWRQLGVWEVWTVSNVSPSGEVLP